MQEWKKNRRTRIVLTASPPPTPPRPYSPYPLPRRGWMWVDPLVSLGVSLGILGCTVPLLQQSAETLLQRAPRVLVRPLRCAALCCVAHALCCGCAAVVLRSRCVWSPRSLPHYTPKPRHSLSATQPPLTLPTLPALSADRARRSWTPSRISARSRAWRASGGATSGPSRRNRRGAGRGRAADGPRGEPCWRIRAAAFA